MFKPKTLISRFYRKSSDEWFEYSRGTRTTPQRGLCDFWVMSQNPKSVSFMLRVLQTLEDTASVGVSKPDDLWFKLAGHATAANRSSYSIFLLGSVKSLFKFSKKFETQ